MLRPHIAPKSATVARTHGKEQCVVAEKMVTVFLLLTPAFDAACKAEKWLCCWKLPDDERIVADNVAVPVVNFHGRVNLIGALGH